MPRTITFDIDYSYCPKGHDWIHIGSSTLYCDVFWCEQCDCFYEPTVKAIPRGDINKSFNSDREQDLIDYAKFLAWKSKLTMKDMKVFDEWIKS